MEHFYGTLKRELWHFYWHIANKMTIKVAGAPFNNSSACSMILWEGV